MMGLSKMDPKKSMQVIDQGHKLLWINLLGSLTSNPPSKAILDSEIHGQATGFTVLQKSTYPN